MILRHSVYVLLLFVSGITLSLTQNPFLPVTDNCSLKKCLAPVKFAYSAGSAYRYRYSANTASSVLGVSARSTTLTLQCDVIVHVITPCEHALSLENVRLHTVAVDDDNLTDKDIESESFTGALENYQLRYGFQDGVVDSVCPDAADPSWSVNIKKGIISTLQNSQDRIDLDYSDIERDVTGDCPTTYRVAGVEAAGMVIQKVRQLNACVGRFAHTSHIQGVSYNIKSPVQNIPLVRSSSECRQVVLNSRIESSTCSERHLLSPFSSDQSGAVTVTAQNITLVETTDYNAARDLVEHRETLLYDHLPAKSASHTREKSLGEAEALVQDLCKDDSEVRVDSTTQFSRLIDDLRGMTLTEITSLYRLSPSICRHGQQLIRDALPVVSTAASLELTRQLIIDGDVTPEVANTWLMALNFIPSVDAEMLRTAGGLLAVRRASVRTRALLSAGAVVHQYCRQHSGCSAQPDAIDIVQRLAAPLGADCAASSADAEKKVLLALRAIGNAGTAPAGVVDVISQCFLRHENPARIKVAAIEAFRRFSCAVHREEMRVVFRDMQEDSEVRIAAYLGLMRCPSHQEIGLVRETLELEQVNQVGSFMWTHLMNLQETSSPYQLEIQGLLADLELKQKFATDARKFSRNFEVSGFNSEYHVGTSLDSNLVYSTKSYVPRSLNANLTLQLFGESVNLVEVGARVEGMERYLESIFAPGGSLHDAAPEPLFRSRRTSKKSKLERIKSDFAAEERFGDPLASFNLKVFGHEVDNIDLREDDMKQLVSWAATKGPGELMSILSSTESLDISRSVKFLEGTYIVPTGTGLPLNLTASAVAAVNVQMSGNAQIDRLIRDRQLDLAFRLRPSGAVTFHGTMMVDGMAVQLGMGMKATMHSSTLVDTSLKMDGFKLVEAKVNMPKDRMDIYNFESSLQFIHQDKQNLITSEITMEGDKHQQVSLNSCTGGEQIKGWRTCAHLMYVNASENTLAPHFPLTGPAKMGIFVEKTDKTMEGYKLEWRVTETQFEHNLRVLFDTPRSVVNRRVELNLKRSRKHGRIGFRIKFPGDELTGRGETSWAAAKKGVQFELQRQGVEVLAVTAQLQVQDGGMAVVYRPVFIVNFLKNPYANLRGYVKVASDSTTMSREMELTLHTPIIRLGLSSNATQTEDLYSSDIVLRHSRAGAEERELRLQLEALDREDNNSVRQGRWLAALDFDLSETVRAQWAARWDHESSQDGSLNKLQTAVRPEDFDVRPSFAAGYALDFTATEDSSRKRVKLELQYWRAGLDLLLSVDHNTIYQGLTNHIILRYAPGRQLESTLNVTGVPLWRSGQLQGSWQLRVPGYQQPLQLRGALTHVPRLLPNAGALYDFSLDGTWVSGGRAEARGQYLVSMHPLIGSLNRTVAFNLTVEDQKMLEGDLELTIGPQAIIVGVQVDHGGSEYGVTVKYEMTNEAPQLERAVSVALTYPGASYSAGATLSLGEAFRASLDLSLNGQRDILLVVGGRYVRPLPPSAGWSRRILEWLVDVKWDANRDPSQRLSVDFKLGDLAPGSRNMSVALVYPYNTAELTMRRQMFGDLSQLQYNNHVLLAFGSAEPAEITIEATTDLRTPSKSLSLDVVATSPAPGWRRNRLNLSYSRSGGVLDSKLEVAAGGHQAALLVSADSQLPAALRASAQLTSSVRKYNGQLALDYTARQHDVSAQLTLKTSADQYRTTLTLEDLSRDQRRRYRAQLNATTPFQGMHEISYSLDGILDRGSVEVTAKSRVENIGHDLTLTGSGWRGDQRMEGILSLDQIHPASNRLTVSLVVDPTELGRAFKASVQWPDSRLAVEGDAHFASLQDFGLGLQFVSPFEAINDAGLMVKHKRAGWKINSEARVGWLLENPVALMVDADLTSVSVLDFQTELSLPVRQWSRLTAGFRNRLDRQTRSLVAGLEASIAEYKFAVAADGSLGVRPTDKRFGTVSVTLPAGAVEQVTIATSVLSSRAGVYETFFSPVWRFRDGNLQEIRLTSTVDVSRWTSATGRPAQAHVRLLTPWMEMLVIEVAHDQTASREFSSSAVASLGQSSGRLTADMTPTSDGFKLDLKTTSNIAAVPTITSETTVSFGSIFRLNAVVLTPEEYHLTLGTDMFTGSEPTMFDAQLTTPHPELDRVALSVKLSGDRRQREILGVLTLPGYERFVRLTGTLRHMDLRLALITPFDTFRAASLEMSAVAASGRFDPEFKLVWDRNIISLSGTSRMGENNIPRQITGTMTIDVPISPRISGRFQLTARNSREELAYDLTMTSNVGRENYQLNGEILAGPKQYGLTVQSTSSDERARVSASAVLSLQKVPGVSGLKLELTTPHPPLTNTSLNLEYRVLGGRRQLSAKLLHPQLSVELAGKLQLASWRQFEVGADATLKMGSIHMQRSVRVYHIPGPEGGNSRAGLGWRLASAQALGGWAQYHLLLEYSLPPGAVKASLVTGPEVDQDRTAASDLRAGLDLNFDPTFRMVRGVLTVHFGDGVYTFDTDYSARQPYTGNVRLTRRARGVDWMLTARAVLTPAADAWRAVLNLTLPVDGYKSVDVEAAVTPAPGVYTLTTHIDIDPQSSFYQHTEHRLEVTGDVRELPEVKGNLRYVHHDLDDTRDLMKLSGDLSTTYNRRNMGLDLTGELNDGTYTLTALQSSLARGKTGKIELTTSYPDIEDFLAQYKFERGDGAEAVRTTFRSVYNQNALVDGTYTLTVSDGGASQRHLLDLDNPLQPLTADMTYTRGDAQKRVDVTVTSQRDGTQRASGWGQVSYTPSGRRLEANVTLPWRTVQLEHSSQRTAAGYERGARVALSPEAFAGYQLTVTRGTEVRGEEGGSARLQLDVPARSVAATGLVGFSSRRRNDVHRSGRARLHFQWDAERQPERQVGGEVKVFDLSTADNFYYNVTFTADIVGKPVTLETSVQRSPDQPLGLDALFAYSADRDSHITLAYNVQRQSRGKKNVMRSNLVLSHPVSRLSVTGKGILERTPTLIKLSGAYTYLDIEDRTLKSTVDLSVDRKMGEFSAQLRVPSVTYELKSTASPADYRINGAAIPSGAGAPQTVVVTAQRDRPLITAELLYDPEQMKHLYMGGGLTNNRTVRLEAFRQSGQYRVDDAVFFVRLNHSHLLTSQAHWRTELAAELRNWLVETAAATRETVEDMTSAEWEVKAGAIESSLVDALGQEVDIVVEQFTSSSPGTLKGDYEDLKYAVQQAYDEDEFYLQTVISFIYGDDNSVVNALLGKLEQWTETLMSELGIIGDTVYNKLNYFIEFLRSLVSPSGEGDRTVADTLREVLTEMANAYNQWAKRMWRSASLRIRQKYREIVGSIELRLMQLADMYRPHLFMLHHQIETNVIQVVRDTLRWWYGEFRQSQLYQFVQAAAAELDQIYRDISERDAVTNFFDYSQRIISWLSSTIGLQDVFGEPGRWLQEFWDNPPPGIAEAKQFLTICYYKITWVVNHLGIPAKIQSIVTKVYYEGDQFWSQTAIQGAQRYFEGKSIMVMRPHHGYISFIQVLPMPWYALNQQPVWKELPELQKIQRLRDFFKGSGQSFSFHDFIYEYWPGHDPTEWLPPFKGHAVLSGSSTFVTFDGRLYTFETECQYLLAADLLADRFAVKAAFRRRGQSKKTLTVSAGNHEIVLGGNDGFRLTVDGRPGEAPLSAGPMRAVRSGDVVTISVDGWMELRCNQRSDVCALQLSRWMFGRTGGLLGTLDNEPFTDMQTPSHHQASLPFFAQSWTLAKCSDAGAISEPRGAPVQQLSARMGPGMPARHRSDGFCWGLLGSPRSDYRTCYRLVPPESFLAACEQQKREDRCVAVRAYVQACQRRGWPLKMPNKCIQCTIAGQTVSEGKTVRVRTRQPSTQIVFVVEAKQCNANMTTMRSMQRLLLGLHYALRNEGFATTSFAVVSYGGDDQDEPQVMTVGGKIFAPYKKIFKAFKRITPGTGNSNAFGALRHAAMLPFSPGVSRTFVLMPCSPCWSSAGGGVDYTTLANAFAEQQITLHVLLDGELRISKRKNKLIGIDNDRAFTLRDDKTYRGDAALLNHVQPPKQELGLCEPLARKQTKGSVFSGGKLRPRVHPQSGKLQIRPRTLKKFVSVFGRRVAETARPDPCQLCECASDVEGTVRPVCVSCASGLLLPSDPEDEAFFEDS